MTRILAKLIALAFVSTANAAVPAEAEIDRVVRDAAAQRSLVVAGNRLNRPVYPFLLGADPEQPRTITPACSYVAGFVLEDKLQQWGWVHVAVCGPGEFSRSTIADAQRLQEKSIEHINQLRPKDQIDPIGYPPRHANLESRSIDYWSVVMLDVEQKLAVIPTLVLQHNDDNVIVQLADFRMGRCIYLFSTQQCEDLYPWLLNLALKLDELHPATRIAHPLAGLSYSALPFNDKVVDADTKHPLEGVIVVADWRIEERRGGGGRVLTSTESITKPDGRFSMPGWGPLEVTTYQADGLPLRMSPNQPVLYLFKPGYEPQQAELKYHDTAYLNDPWSTGDPVRAVANDRTIELRRWNKSDAAYNQRLIFWNAGFLNSCGWARTPRMTVALIREGERLKGLNPSKRNEVLDPQWLKGDRLGQHCVSNEAMQAILDEALK